MASVKGNKTQRQDSPSRRRRTIAATSYRKGAATKMRLAQVPRCQAMQTGRLRFATVIQGNLCGSTQAHISNSQARFRPNDQRFPARTWVLERSTPATSRERFRIGKTFAHPRQDSQHIGHSQGRSDVRIAHNRQGYCGRLARKRLRAYRPNRCLFLRRPRTPK